MTRVILLRRKGEDLEQNETTSVWRTLFHSILIGVDFHHLVSVVRVFVLRVDFNNVGIWLKVWSSNLTTVMIIKPTLDTGIGHKEWVVY